MADAVVVIFMRHVSPLIFTKGFVASTCSVNLYRSPIHKKQGKKGKLILSRMYEVREPLY